MNDREWVMAVVNGGGGRGLALVLQVAGRLRQSDRLACGECNNGRGGGLRQGVLPVNSRVRLLESCRQQHANEGLAKMTEPESSSSPLPISPASFLPSCSFSLPFPKVMTEDPSIRILVKP